MSVVNLCYQSHCQHHLWSNASGDVIISRLCFASCTGFLCGSTSCSRLHFSYPPVLVWHCPSYLANDCQLVADARFRQLRSADTRTLVDSWTCSSFGDRTFATAGPQVWNSLPPILRLCGLSYGQFRRLLKTFYLDSEAMAQCELFFLTAPNIHILT